MMMFGGMMLFWVLIILGAIWLVWALLGNTRPTFLTGGSGTPRQVLDQRFARGEISRDEYDQILTDLSR